MAICDRAPGQAASISVPAMNGQMGEFASPTPAEMRPTPVATLGPFKVVTPRTLAAWRIALIRMGEGG
jgi:hypothetical protein